MNAHERAQLGAAELLLTTAEQRHSAEGDDWDGGMRALYSAHATVLRLLGRTEAADAYDALVAKLARLDTVPTVDVAQLFGPSCGARWVDTDGATRQCRLARGHAGHPATCAGPVVKP